MNRTVLLMVLYMVCTAVSGQTRKDLEEQRKRTLEEIGYVDNMIRETAKQKSTGITDIRIIGNRLTLRENVITGLKDEIELLNNRIELNTLAVDLMENDLEVLKNDYSKTIINSYKEGKSYPEIGYLLSARDFNQGYKRLRYLQQMARFRRRETEIIMELKTQIDAAKEKMKEDLANISGLKQNEEIQKSLLIQEQSKKRKMVNSLSNKEKQLRKDLEEKKRIAQKIESEINRIIEEEKKRSSGNELTPEMKIISNNFIENKGRLPWPVEKGIITEKFGPQDHPVLTYVKENNPGIEITSNGKIIARSIFTGEVVRIFAIQGANMSLIIKHGKYFSVYQNLVNVKVSKNQMVETKQELGEVFCDDKNGSASVLKFMIFEEREKVDPEQWIVKK
jgi:septal ring factor EnvC (AmiA/AmiB activator)